MNEQTLITVIFLAGIFIAVFITFIKRFTSKRTCCGTEKVRFQKKKLKKVAGKVVFQVDGMHCNNCRASVENAVNKFEGMAGKASLEHKTLTVSYEPDVIVEEEKIAAALGELGFTARKVS